MLERDLFVGLVAVTLGLVMVFCSRGSSEQLARFNNTRFLIERLGETGARSVLMLIGCGLILAGGVLVWRGLPRQLESPSSHRPVRDRPATAASSETLVCLHR